MRRVMVLTAALPDGSALASNQAIWRRAVEDHPDFLVLRRDSQESLLRIVWVFMREARQDMTTAPGWDTLVARTGLSRATVARWLRWLREHGLLGVVEHGTTPQYRPRLVGLAGKDEGNHAAVYVLATPVTSTDAPGDEHETPPVGEPPVGRSTAGARTREHASPLRGPDPAALLGTNMRPRADLREWPLHARTRTRSDELRAADRLRAESLDLRSITPRHVRSVIRPWLRAGWTVQDLLLAIDYTPDGKPRTWTTRASRPGGWLRHRLSAWEGHPSPSQAKEAARAAQRAAEQQRRQDEALVQGEMTPEGRQAGIAACRAVLAAARRNPNRLRA